MIDGRGSSVLIGLADKINATASPVTTEIRKISPTFIMIFSVVMLSCC